MPSPTILPDSRRRDRRQFVPSALGNQTPIFCANCGADGGLVPEESCTFAFYLCNPCFATCGELTTFAVMPDEVFFEKLKQEQLASYGRYLTEPEVAAIVAADASPLATLIKEGR